MADHAELLDSLALDDVARDLGTDRETAASVAAIPALLGGTR